MKWHSKPVECIDNNQKKLLDHINDHLVTGTSKRSLG